MLRILDSSQAIPFSFIVDDSAEFEAGMIAQLNSVGNNVVCSVSDGKAPIGLIDDYKTRSFSKVSYNETVLVPASGVLNSGGKLVTPVDIKYELNNPYVFETTFISDVDVILNSKNGVITFPAGTELNYDMAGTGTPDYIKAIVTYSYQVPNVPGDDTTIASKRVTVWYQRIIAETDIFDPRSDYWVNGSLFVSPEGKLTSIQYSPGLPCVAICIGPPSLIVSSLQFIWL